MEAILESNFTCVICTTVTVDVKQSSCCGATLCAACVTKTKSNSCCKCRNRSFVMFKNRAMHEVLETCRRTCTECKVELDIIAFKRHLCQAQIAQLPAIKLAPDYESLLRGASYKCTLTKPRGALEGEQILIHQVSATIHAVHDDDVVVYLSDVEKYVKLSLHAAHHLVVERQEAEKKAGDNMQRVQNAELELMFAHSGVDSEDYDDVMFSPIPASATRAPAFIDINSDSESDSDDSEFMRYSPIPAPILTPAPAPAPARWTSLEVADMTNRERLMYNSVLKDDVLAEVLPRRSRRTGVKWRLVSIYQCGSDRRHYTAPFRADRPHVRVPSSRNVRTRRQLVLRDLM